MINLNIICKDCRAEHAQWRPSIGCYLCHDCYTEDLLDANRLLEEHDDGFGEFDD